MRSVLPRVCVGGREVDVCMSGVCAAYGRVGVLAVCPCCTRGREKRGGERVRYMFQHGVRAGRDGGIGRDGDNLK